MAWPEYDDMTPQQKRNVKRLAMLRRGNPLRDPATGESKVVRKTKKTPWSNPEIETYVMDDKLKDENKSKKKKK